MGYTRIFTKEKEMTYASMSSPRKRGSMRSHLHNQYRQIANCAESTEPYGEFNAGSYWSLTLCLNQRSRETDK